MHLSSQNYFAEISKLPLRRRASKFLLNISVEFKQKLVALQDSYNVCSIYACDNGCDLRKLLVISQCDIGTDMVRLEYSFCIILLHIIDKIRHYTIFIFCACTNINVHVKLHF